MKLNVLILLIGVASAIKLQDNQAKLFVMMRDGDADAETSEGASQNEITGDDEKVDRKPQDIENARDKDQPIEDEGGVDNEEAKEKANKDVAAAGKKTAAAEADIEAAEAAGKKEKKPTDEEEKK